MGLRFRFACLIALMVLVVPAFAQDRATEVKLAFARAQHLRHGINASEWFAQKPGHYSPAETSAYTDDADIALMAQIGFDSVRLSIDAWPLEKAFFGHDDNNFIGRLDHAVDQMGEAVPVRQLLGGLGAQRIADPQQDAPASGDPELAEAVQHGGLQREQ